MSVGFGRGQGSGVEGVGAFGVVTSKLTVKAGNQGGTAATQVTRSAVYSHLLLLLLAC